MLLLVAAASVVAQSAAMESDTGSFVQLHLQEPVKEAVKNYREMALDAVKGAWSYGASKASAFTPDVVKNHPYVAGIAAAVAVPAVTFGGYKLYQRYKKPAQAPVEKKKDAKKAKKNTPAASSKYQTAKKLGKYGVGLGALVGLGYGAYATGYASQAYNFVAPYVTKKAAAITGGVLTTAVAGTLGYKMLKGNKFSKEEAEIIEQAKAASMAITQNNDNEINIDKDTFETNIALLMSRLQNKSKDAHKLCQDLYAAVTAFLKATERNKEAAEAELRKQRLAFVRYFNNLIKK